MPQWEHRIERNLNGVQDLNAIGGDGWELVSVVATVYMGTGLTWFYYFKREKGGIDERRAQ